MGYGFESYLTSIQTNWYLDDPLVGELLSRYVGDIEPETRDELSAWGETVAGRLCLLAEESALPENRPWLRHFDAYNRRVDEIVLPDSTLEALREIGGGQRLGAVWGNPFVFYTKAYLYAQNGEAGVGCPMACTDGMVRALEALGNCAEHRKAVADVRGSTREHIFHGAQFITEIQGGSDVPANELEAVSEGDLFRLHGPKWFCSNINADYFLVTARPRGAPPDGTGVALFLVPAYLDPDAPQRNGYTIDRLKDKLGTRELATAEVTFDGAIAYPLGPLNKGISNVLKHVLVTSRFYCVLTSVACLRQAERLVEAYTVFRSAFGRKLVDYPLVRQTLTEIREGRKRTLAVLFELLDLWEKAKDGHHPEVTDFRIMMSLSKAVLTYQTTHLLHEAMLLMGGNGIEERFSPLPRLYRDAVIMETWEGPHNVLFTQALRDMLRFEVDPTAFVSRIAGETRSDLAKELSRILGIADDPEATVLFGALASQLVDAFGKRLLAELDTR